MSPDALCAHYRVAALAAPRIKSGVASAARAAPRGRAPASAGDLVAPGLCKGEGAWVSSPADTAAQRGGAVSIIDQLETWLAALTRPLAWIGVLGMLAAATATVVDVLLRWLAGRGVLALNEIVSMVFGVAIAACIPAGVAGGINVKIDIFARWITGRLAAWLDVFRSACLLFFAVLTYRIYVFTGTLYAQGRSTVILGWPMWPFISVADALLPPQR